MITSSSFSCRTATFDELAIGATIAELTALGHLARPRVLPQSRGALENDQLALEPVTAYQQHAGVGRAAVFCLTVEKAAYYDGRPRRRRHRTTDRAEILRTDEVWEIHPLRRPGRRPSPSVRC